MCIDMYTADIVIIMQMPCVQYIYCIEFAVYGRNKNYTRERVWGWLKYSM